MESLDDFAVVVGPSKRRKRDDEIIRRLVEEMRHAPDFESRSKRFSRLLEQRDQGRTKSKAKRVA